MRLRLLEEPELQFATGGHVDIRAGLREHGTFDRDEGHVPKQIGLGLVGTTATTDGVRDWIESCRRGVASTEEKYVELRPDFPGVRKEIFGTSFALSDTTTRTVSRHELRSALNKNDALAAVVDLFFDHARDLSNKSGVHVLIVAPPYEVFALGDPPTEAAPPDDGLDDAQRGEFKYRRNFHDLFKARALALRVPCQLLRPDTYNLAPARGKGHQKRRGLQDNATRAWNFHVALYYKAGGVPWRLVRSRDELSTCYVGASFYKSLDGTQLLTSVAQVFNERGEGLIVQGGSARIERSDRSPHLLEDDARTLLASGLASYRREHKTVPARVVIHKTSYFDPQEIAGCHAAATEEKVEILDLVSVRPSRTRVFLAAQAAVPRGTLLTFDEPVGTLYLRGTVPYFGLYPGMYVPRPLEYHRNDGETGSVELARELLQLSKLNFNNTQFDSGDPITIRAAKRVGDILKNVGPGSEVDSRFRYFT